MSKQRKESDQKLRLDMNEVAHRVMRQATGQEPKTPPPGERSEEEKNPEAVARGAKGGEARDQAMTAEEHERLAQTAALARWKQSRD